MVKRTRRRAFTAILAMLALAAAPARGGDDPPPVSAPAPAPAATRDAAGCDGRLAGERVRWIVPYRPGSTYDVTARILAPHFAALLGAQPVIENRPGGSGLVGHKATLTAVAEGATVVNVLSGPQALVGAAHGRLPDPGTGMHVLGQIAGSRYVVATGADSPFETLDDVFAAERPLVFAVFEPKGSSFLRIVNMAELLGIEIQFVTGYRGSAQIAMAALRGEVDLVMLGYHGQESLYANGDLRPLMVFNGEVDAPGFAELPRFGGPDGVALQRARALGRDLDEAEADLQGLMAFATMGRFVASPEGTDPSLVPCLRATLDATFALPDFRRDVVAAGQVMDVESAEATLALVERARSRLARFKRSTDAAAARLSQ
jgi:tripartite-type tricarboxylate transporter receptor subunit TctC